MPDSTASTRPSGSGSNAVIGPRPLAGFCMGVHCHAELPHDATVVMEAACDAGASSVVVDAVPDPNMFTTSCARSRTLHSS